LKRLKLSAVPLEPLAAGRLVNRWIQRRALRQIQAWLDQEDCWLVIGRPSALGLELCSGMKGRRVLYDVMDDTPEFSSGVSTRWMNWVHKATTHSAGHVWCSSLRLQELILASTGREAPLVRNASGVMLNATRAPSGPPWVLGYVGTIADWFDWDTVIQLARQVPAVQLHLYGPMVVGRPHNLPANVQCLPAVPHNEIADLMAQWHAGLIPFKKNKLTDGVDPVKYYEYRACGLAVLSTRFGDMNQHQDDEGVWFLEDVPLTTLPDRLSRWWTRPHQERVRTDSGWANNFAQGATELGWMQP
jgi:glycosyltransferase involved in cell wall biosynthesis